ncbi:hypothetical protein Tco_0209828 [Tanacetum coccineum]
MVRPLIEDGTTRTKKYEELLIAEKLKADCDLKATNIVLQGLPLDVYSIVNQHKVSKEIWDRVKLLMQGTKLSLQEKECLAVPVFNQGDDPIAYLNKAMAFLTVVASLRFHSTNNQLINSSNMRNHATIQDDKVIVQQVQGRQGQSYVGTNYKGNATSFRGNNAGGQTRTEDLNAYDFDCDDVPNAKKAQRIKPTLYDGSVISSQHAASLVIDDEETLIWKNDNQNALEMPEDFENNDLKAQLQAKDTTICKLKEHIKSIRENDKEEKVKHDMDEIETINIELEHSVDKLLFENERLHKEIKHLKKFYKDQFDSIKKTRALSKEHWMFNLYLDPLAPRLLKNRDVHIDYLKYTQDQANILWGIVKQAKAKQPLDNALDFACKHAKRIQELLVYVRDTCPNVYKPSEKLVAVTPMNKVKKVRYSEPLTSSSNIHKQVKSSKTPDFNIPVLPYIGLESSTSASRSQPAGNKKNDRISQTPSSNMKNKVEVQRRRVNLSSNKKNRVREPICDTNVKHTMLNANFELICVKCKQCMFDANHDVCFLDFVNDVNVRSKSKSAKKSQHHNNWKPTGKVFTKVGYKWKPIGRLFTIVCNSCPLTRITRTTVVHLKETTSNSVETPKPEIKVYSRRPKQIKTVGLIQIVPLVMVDFDALNIYRELALTA